MFVYDVTKRSSFESIPRWLKELRDHAHAHIVLALIGNKTDMEGQREVSTDEGMQMANEVTRRFRTSLDSSKPASITCARFFDFRFSFPSSARSPCCYFCSDGDAERPFATRRETHRLFLLDAPLLSLAAQPDVF